MGSKLSLPNALTTGLPALYCLRLAPSSGSQSRLIHPFLITSYLVPGISVTNVHSSYKFTIMKSEIMRISIESVL